MSRHLACKHCGSVRIVSKTTRFRGVDYIKSKRLYRARATINYVTYNLGWFKKEIEALSVYERFVLEHNLHAERSNFLYKKAIG